MNTTRHAAARAVALAACLSMALVPFLSPVTALAQSAPAAVQASPDVAQAEPFDGPGNLTPEQLRALQEQIIKLSQNPVGNIAIIPFQNNFNFGVGPYQRLQYNLNLQPVVPIMLNPQWNLISRTIIPIIANPSSAPPAVCASAFGCGATFGIGDLTPQFYFAPSKPGNFIWGVGPQFLFPTGAPSQLSAGKYGIGPAAVGLIMPGDIVTGVLATQMWSIGGPSPEKPNVSSLFIQPFFNYNLKRGNWAVFFGSSGITANFSATPQQGKWNVPIGTGVTKTFKLGPQPMQLGVFYYANVVRTLTSPTGSIRFNWNLLYPIRRGIQLPGS